MRLTGALFAAALLTLAGCTSLPGAPALTCRFTPGPADGIGGTGLGTDVLLRLIGVPNDEERGIGGTGVIAHDNGPREERGLGGTGIIGVVTGFGSVCVNGYKVEVTDATRVTVEGLAGTAQDIRLGQVVEIEARSHGNTLAAASINVRLAVAGPVTAVSPDGATLTVAGQTVTAAGFGGSVPATPPAVGQWVAVSGLRRVDDVIVATSVVALPEAGRQVVVSGPIRDDAGTRRIGALKLVDGAQAASGERVIVRGPLTAESTIAAVAQIEAPPAFLANVATLSVQAFTNVTPTATLDLGAIVTRVSPEALPSTLRAELPLRAVQMDGHFQSGVFIPDRVLLMERPNELRPLTPDRMEITPGTAIPLRPIDGGEVILPTTPNMPIGSPIVTLPVMPTLPQTPIDSGAAPPERPEIQIAPAPNP